MTVGARVLLAVLCALLLGGCFSVTLRAGYGGPAGANAEVTLDFRERTAANDTPANAPPAE